MKIVVVMKIATYVLLRGSIMDATPLNCWFARDVTAAMLVVKNKSISLLWELNSIFM